MGGIDKPEFTPLLRPGRHLSTMDDLEHMCVVPFETSSTRPRLMRQLRQLASHLASCVSIFDLWVDGSFITAKMDPEDIDLTIVLDGDVADRLSPQAQAFLSAIMSDQHSIPDLHAFVVVTRPRGHPDQILLAEAAAEMSSWWQVMRGGWCKGMPVVRWGETDVGLRLFP